MMTSDSHYILTHPPIIPTSISSKQKRARLMAVMRIKTVTF